MMLTKNITLFLLVLSNFIVVNPEVSAFISTSSLNGLPFNFSLNATCIGNDSVCPPWGYCDETSGTCKCFMKSDVLICDPNGVQNFILVGYCLTISDVSDEPELGLCIYNSEYLGHTKFNVDYLYDSLPLKTSSLNAEMCGAFNRTGTLCGKCSNNTYLQAYSYDMSCCSCGNQIYSFLKYIVVSYLPLTLFCMIVLVLQINIHASQLQGYVFFCQILASPVIARYAMFYLGEGGLKHSPYKIAPQLIGTLYGIWNLDFFRLFDLGICFKISPLATLSLDLLIALYPLVFMLFIYGMTVLHDSSWRVIVMIAKPFKSFFHLFKRNWNIKSSVIEGFATFIFLSNVKLLAVCYDLLIPVQVCHPSKNTTCKWALFYDSTVGYFSSEHIPYAVLAIVVFIVFVITPMLTLALYPLSIFQRCASHFPQRWQIALHILMDSFQGCYKDGTEPGCRDCRWFSAVAFVLRLIIFSTYGFFYESIVLWVMIIVCTAIITIIVNPNKPQFKHHSDHFAVFLIFLACLFTCAFEVNKGFYVTKIFYSVVIMIGVLHQGYFFVQIFYIIKKRMSQDNIKFDKTFMNK